MMTNSTLEDSHSFSFVKVFLTILKFNAFNARGRLSVIIPLPLIISNSVSSSVDGLLLEVAVEPVEAILYESTFELAGVKSAAKCAPTFSNVHRWRLATVVLSSVIPTSLLEVQLKRNCHVNL